MSNKLKFSYDFYIKVAKKSSFNWKYLLHIYPTWQWFVFVWLFTRTKTKIKAKSLNSKQYSKDKINTKLQHVWNIGVLSFWSREEDANTGDLKIFHTKNVKIWPSISPIIYVFSLQHYAWLVTYERHTSVGTKLSGSLIVSPVLWVLSSHNTFSVTHSDKAS